LRRLPSFLLIAVLLPSAWAADRLPQPAKIVSEYAGGYKDDFPQELNRVQSFVLAAQSDIATSLGLQYGQGFLYPVTIRFEDGAPAVNETPYFYVRTKGSGDNFAQELVANVEAYAKHRSDLANHEGSLRNGFRYALTELMLNDLAGGDSDKMLPLWIQEGLAVYMSGDGEELVEKVAKSTHRAHAHELVGDLNSPGPYLTPSAWANYYLAIKYIADAGALQAFVRAITSGTSAADTVSRVLGQEWPTFVTHVREFSSKAFEASAASDDDSKK
jgi:hypothetical protein